MKLFSSSLKDTFSLIRSSGKLNLGNIIVFGITVIGYPIITRLYSDIEYGNFALFQSISLILIQVSVLGYHEALLLVKKLSDFKTLYTSLLCLLLATVFLVSSLIMLVPKSLTENYSINHHEYLPLAMLLGGLILLNNNSLLKRSKFTLISGIRILDRSTFQAATIGLSNAVKGKFNGLIVGYLLAQLFAVTAAIPSVRKNIVPIKSLARVRRLFIEHINFPKYAIVAGLLMKALQHLPILILPIFVSGATTGQFALSYRVLSIPEMLIGVGLGQVFYLKIVDRYNKNIPFKSDIISLWKLLANIGFLPTFVIFFFGPEIFSFTFGSDWTEAGELSCVLAFTIYFLFVTTPTSATFSVLKGQKYSLIYAISHFSIRLCTLYFGLLLGDLKTALVVMVIGDLVVGLFYYKFMLNMIDKWENSIRSINDK